MKWTVGTKIGAGFGVALLILITIGAISYLNTIVLTDTTTLRQRSHQVLEKLDDVLSTLKDAETGQRGFLLTGEDRYLEPYLAARASINEKLRGTNPDAPSLRYLTRDNPSQQSRLDQLDPLIDGKDGKFAELQQTIDLRKDKEKGFESALKVVLTDKGKVVMDEIRAKINEMRNEELALLKTRVKDADAAAENTKQTIVWGTLGALIVLSLVALGITANIATPVKELSAIAERIAGGDLSGSVSVSKTRQDEIGTLAQSFARMTDSLRSMAGTAGKIAEGDLRMKVKPQSEQDVLGNAFSSMLGNLQQLTTDLAEGVNVLSASANEISTSIAQLASTASESAAAVSETTTTVEEVRQTAQVASQKAKYVSESAQKAAQISQSGRKSTDDVGTGMTRIRQQMDAIAASMMRLSEQSQTIGQIIATVEDLAAQSNLLAVNAAIEAAKAGEHGRGFGVVAQEVKSLAEQSRKATTQVRTILSEIQKATSAAVMATEQGSKAVEAGTKQTEIAAESIQALTVSVTEAAHAATQIAASSQQQLIGVDQVASAMESIKQASTQNVAGAKQLEAAARNLSDLGSRLKRMLGRYKVDASNKV